MPIDKQIEECFWKKVKVMQDNDCWEWQGTISNGYGTLMINGKRTLAHRLSYEIAKREIGNSLMILHSCNNKKCVNPNHLRAGTALDNANDRKRFYEALNRGVELNIDDFSKLNSSNEAGRQVTFFMQPKDINRLTKLTQLITPLKPNRAYIVQWALLFADMRIKEFEVFVQGQEAK